MFDIKKVFENGEMYIVEDMMPLTYRTARTPASNAKYK
jgi:hypothetical protein